MQRKEFDEVCLCSFSPASHNCILTTSPDIFYWTKFADCFWLMVGKFTTFSEFTEGIGPEDK